jgi:hypothetical protein
MNDKNTGGPAFPTGLITDPRNGQIIGGSNGMTLRDYFAAKAMLGIMAMNKAEEFVDENGDEMIYEEGEVGTLFVHTDFLAKEAYMIADMMLKAREA